MRLIDGDALFNWGKYKLSDAVKYGNKDKDQQHFSHGTLMMYEIADEIDEAPTIDPVKHGRWEPVKNARGGHECSNCHDYAPSFANGAEYAAKYCPNCGAKMEEKQ